MSIKKRYDISLKEFMNKAMESARKRKDGTYIYNLGEHDGYRYAIVIGWANGFEEDVNDTFSDGNYHLCIKMARQTVNSILQCDYDIDWDELLYSECMLFLEGTDFIKEEFTRNNSAHEVIIAAFHNVLIQDEYIGYDLDKSESILKKIM